MIGRIGLVRALRSNASPFLQRAPTTSAFLTRPVTGTVYRSFASATDAYQKSCYLDIDFQISEEEYVFSAIKKFAAFDIGCLVTLDDKGRISGVVSERDVISKIALLGRKSKDVKIKEISTQVAKLTTASPDDSVDECMNKMVTSDIRHLPILTDEGAVVGMLSIKDCVKAVLEDKEAAIEILSNFACGKGGTFVVD